MRSQRARPHPPAPPQPQVHYNHGGAINHADFDDDDRLRHDHSAGHNNLHINDNLHTNNSLHDDTAADHRGDNNLHGYSHNNTLQHHVGDRPRLLHRSHPGGSHGTRTPTWQHTFWSATVLFPCGTTGYTTRHVVNSAGWGATGYTTALLPIGPRNITVNVRSATGTPLRFVAQHESPFPIQHPDKPANRCMDDRPTFVQPGDSRSNYLFPPSCNRYRNQF